MNNQTPGFYYFWIFNLLNLLARYMNTWALKWPCELWNSGLGSSQENLKPRRLLELELELIQTQMTQKPMLRVEVGMRVRCANKANAELFMRGRGIGQYYRKNTKTKNSCG